MKIKQYLQLIRSTGLGARSFHRLLAEYGSPMAVLQALSVRAGVVGSAKYTLFTEAQAEAEIEAARRVGAKVILYGDPLYPQRLAQLSDAPPLLWCMGDLSLLERAHLAVVGTRNASSLGERMARKLAQSLGEAGFVIVSGLARGIDAQAHKSALATGTIAVVAGGVDIDYPMENAALYAEVRGKGLIVSEQPMGFAPNARHFPIRNRIVAGLSQGVVVIEAALQSGSLITARLALDQGREVLAVPGHPFDARASGVNQLLRDGATLVRSASDVLEALPAPKVLKAAPPMRAAPEIVPRQTDESSPLRKIAAIHRQILDRLTHSPAAEDQLLRDLAVPPSLLSPELLNLELRGQIERRSGGMVARVAREMRDD